MKRRGLVSLAIGLLLTLGGIGTAAAHQMEIANAGARAWSTHPHSRACIEDTRADGFSVRADYFRLGNMVMWSIAEDRGSGHSRCSLQGAEVNAIRACMVIPVLPDACTNLIG